mmetsp:Transcript_124221/g.337366  ORF Transcript_124221/g.337366 Transcript_124221/m.337366 type:complete len:375 (+) Transcript_124221:448-1572(+)
MRHLGLDVLVRLLDLEPQEHGVLLDDALQAAEVGAAERPGVLKRVVRLPPLVARRESALQGRARGRVDEERAEARGDAAVPRGVEDELEPFNARGAEGGAADRLPLGEASPQHRGLLHAPLDLPHHAGAHEVHLVPHLVKDPVVDVLPEPDGAVQRPLVHMLLLAVGRLLRRRRLWVRDYVVHLLHDLQDLHADLQRVGLPVDLILHEAEALGAVGDAPVEGLLELDGLAGHAELVGDVEPLGRPEEDGAVPLALAGHGRVPLAEQLQLQLQPGDARAAESRREIAAVQLRTAGPGWSQLLRGLLDNPIYSPRGDVLHLRHRVRHPRDLVLEVEQALVHCCIHAAHAGLHLRPADQRFPGLLQVLHAVNQPVDL